MMRILLAIGFACVAVLQTAFAASPPTWSSIILLPQSTTPGGVVNGQCWTTSAGMFCQIAGSAVGPFGGGGGSAALSALTAATGANTIANGDNAQAWNWTLTTAAKSAFSIGETAAATNGAGNQYLLDVGTLASSTAGPLRVKARGTAVLTIDPTGTLSAQPISSSVVFGAGSGINFTGGTNTSTTTSSGGPVAITGGNGTAGGTVTITAGTGNTGIALSGTLILSGGVGSGSGTNTVKILTPAGGATGGINMATGNSSSTNPSGGLTISTGNALSCYINCSAGPINFITGNAGTVGSGGSNDNGGDFVITLGTGFTGRNGVFKITSLQTSDPSITGAFYILPNDGRVGVSGTTVKHGAASQSSASAPTAPASTSVYTMQGLAGSVTPATTGKILVTISGTIVDPSGTAAGNGLQYQISHGTGTAPTNAAALTGTQDGTVQGFTNPTTVVAADVSQPFSHSAVITGLTIGTTYWLDEAAESIAAVSSMGLQNVSISTIEVP